MRTRAQVRARTRPHARYLSPLSTHAYLSLPQIRNAPNPLRRNDSWLAMARFGHGNWTHQADDPLWGMPGAANRRKDFTNFYQNLRVACISPRKGPLRSRRCNDTCGESEGCSWTFQRPLSLIHGFGRRRAIIPSRLKNTQSFVVIVRINGSHSHHTLGLIKS